MLNITINSSMRNWIISQLCYSNYWKTLLNKFTLIWLWQTDINNSNSLLLKDELIIGETLFKSLFIQHNYLDRFKFFHKVFFYLLPERFILIKLTIDFLKNFFNFFIIVITTIFSILNCSTKWTFNFLEFFNIILRN